MGLLDEANSVIQRHQELCHDLNMDKDAADQAWQSYEKIRHNYILEGDPLHWIACALYVACRNTTVPTVGATDAKIEGNRVSLTRLLRSCKLSLIQFFNKVKKWLDMANVSSELRTKIDCLERNFSVSMVIFKKFQPIFKDMFRDPADDPPRLPRSRKTRRAPCTPSEVFDFCWTLFVCVKAAFPAISDDLVNSYHLLLACCDLMFGNALLADRRDLLNFNFSGLPRNFLQQDYKMATDPPCIIDQLCEKHEGIKLEAKGIKEYCWKPHMRELFEKKFLKGDGINFTGLLELGCFEFNFKSIKKTYEEYVLNVGDFDETIFLGDDANTEIGTPTKISNQNGIDEFQEKLKAKRNLQHFDGAHHLVPSTPLTGRKYLKAKDNSKITPISTATQSVSRLQTLLSGRQATPSDALFEILRSCERKQDVRIEEKVKEMGSLFCTKYTQADDHQPGSHIDFARKRLQLGQSLYYKLLENILSEEKKKKPGFDLTHLLEQDVFLQSLFACCLEIVIFSYNSQRTFPWIVEAFNLEPYHFYKVIEIIVRAEDGLSRDMVKHLNLIEEQILESMAWKGGSPLWENIRNSGLPIPSCEEVSLPSQLMIKEEPLNSDSQPMSPLHNPSICRLTNMDRPSIKNPQQSPVSSVDRFQSPIQPSLAKKRLFADAPASTTATTVTCASPQVTALVAAIKPGQSLLQSPGKTMAFNIQTIQGENGERYIPISHIQGSGSVIIQAQHTQPFTAITGKNLNSATQNNNNNNTIIDKRIKKPKRTGSLGLFFRKFYSLAAIRMQELCSHLKVTDDELRRKIWTCFEHTIIQHTDLMQDRHLDQILMCAVYVICKVTQHERTFTDIMKCYRYQPQARSHVYRSVLLCTKKRRGSGSSSNGASSTSSPAPSDREDAENKEEPNERIRSCSTLSVTHPPSAPPTPTHLAGTSTSFENEDRGDLIKFYNEVYVQKIQDFVLKFSGKINQNDALTLSPLPPSKMQPMSPCRRVSDKHSVYIRSLTPRCIPASPTQPFSYSFHRSPAKDLDTINNMIQLDSRKVGKRLLADDNSDADAPQAKQPALVTRKLHDLIGDRLGKTQD